MQLLALLWLALIQALAVAAPARQAALPVALARARAGRDADATTARRVESAVPRRSEEMLRLARGISGSALARAAGPTAQGGPVPPMLAPAAWPRFPEPRALPTLPHRGPTSHAIATRGRLLPYFPTAPPRQG